MGIRRKKSKEEGEAEGEKRFVSKASKGHKVNQNRPLYWICRSLQSSESLLTLRTFIFVPEFSLDKMSGERYNIHSQLEHLQSKYIGTGHADTTKFDWLTNQARDTCASHIGHFDMINYFALAENESKARVRLNLMEKLVQPCGPPPEKKSED